MALESDVVKKIRKIIKDRGGKSVKIHGDAYQEKEVDILACYQGRFIAIEVKKNKKEKLKPLQAYRLNQWRDAGGWVLRLDCDNVDSVLEKTLDAIEGENCALSGSYH